MISDGKSLWNGTRPQPPPPPRHSFSTSENNTETEAFVSTFQLKAKEAILVEKGVEGMRESSKEKGVKGEAVVKGKWG